MSDVLVVAEHRRGEVQSATFESISAARELADDESVIVGVIGGNSEEFVDAVNRTDVDRVITIDDGIDFNHGVYCQAVVTLVNRTGVNRVLLPHSATTMDYAPAVAERLGYPIVTAVTGIKSNDPIQVKRGMYGGKVQTTVEVAPERAVLTVQEGNFPAADGVGDAEVESLEVQIDREAIGTTVTGHQEIKTGDVDITTKDFLIGVGRGVQDEENLPLLETLADVTGGTLAASRPVVDNGWLPVDRQVGQSGTAVSPRVYLAIGISGAPQHVNGIRNADEVIAINNDPHAPIFDVADYGIVGDLFDVVPALIEECGGTPP